ncbi:bifunctional protein-disulfide isomerase/oxidoreductase DsbC [Thaumasiovibrio sp. DFM-14]|uniref:bifunctional protein-disulfide isomerase/oxidoreductase DsbC n=1 Tax=Thaumasiovibrio sp. DFM-14 TaxID=3384792 RepID=UPI0039A2BD15
MHIFRTSALMLAVVSTLASATSAPDAVQSAMAKLGLEVTAMADSPLNGVKEITTNRGVYYISEDSKTFLAGHLFDLSGDEPVNLTEKRLAEINKERLATLSNEMIVYKAPQEKHVVTVFTDTSCGYCRKLHDEMAAYNKAGITVRYLAFPRGGLNAGNYGQMSAIWCADDQVAAMDQAKSGQFNQSSAECNDIVNRHYQLGVEMGIRGTPAIVLEDGSMIPGYQPADMLSQRLEQGS